jgi:hypothetical protein
LYTEEIMPRAQRIGNRLGVLHVSLDVAWRLRRKHPRGLLLEFGVFQGRDINYLARAVAGKKGQLAAASPVLLHGFDSFRGLPEDWGNQEDCGQQTAHAASPGFRGGAKGKGGHGACWGDSRGGGGLRGFEEAAGSATTAAAAAATAYPKGTFDLGGALPTVEANVRLYAGWFDDTLRPFLAAHPLEPCLFVHADADLYRSTKDVLSSLAADGRLIAGTVVNFDEYANYPGWEGGEHLAWAEVCADFGIRFDYLNYHGPRYDHVPDERYKSNEYGFKSVTVVVTEVDGNSHS